MGLRAGAESVAQLRGGFEVAGEVRVLGGREGVLAVVILSGACDL